MEYRIPELPVDQETLHAFVKNKKYFVDKRRDGFTALTGKEAKAYFHWYMEHIEERIKNLETYIHAQDSSVMLDFSVSSFNAVWDWYGKQIEVEKYTRKELKRMAKEYPKWIRESIMEDDRKFSYKTLAICSDMAIYFAEVFRKNHEQDISWGYFTGRKTMDSVNEPILQGFIKNMYMNPYNVVYNTTSHYIDGCPDSDLYHLYQVWEEYL